MIRDDGRVQLMDIDGAELWLSDNTAEGKPEYELTMEDDGNLVLRDGENTELWSTGTSRGDGSILLPL